MRLMLTGKRREICELLACLCHRNKRRVARVATYQFKGVSFTATGDIMLTVKDTDVPGTVTATISYVDSKGKPAKVDGAPTWVASDPTIVDKIDVAADGLSATLHITDTVGASLITIDADADLGSGVTDITTVDTISVIPGDAVAGNLTFGAVTPDPTP